MKLVVREQKPSKDVLAVPCHNMATAAYYARNELIWFDEATTNCDDGNYYVYADPELAVN